MGGPEPAHCPPPIPRASYSSLVDLAFFYWAGKPLFGILIGLCHNGTPILGVIDQPVLNGAPPSFSSADAPFSSADAPSLITVHNDIIVLNGN
jgi:hypothetical protein